MIIAKNEFVYTTFHSENKLLISVYSGRSNVQLGVDHLKKVVDFYSKNEVKGSVVDISKIFGSFSKGIDFLKQSYYPVAVKSGLMCQAYVVPEDFIVENLSKKIVAMASGFIDKVKLFTDRKEAENWVKSNI